MQTFFHISIKIEFKSYNYEEVNRKVINIFWLVLLGEWEVAKREDPFSQELCEILTKTMHGKAMPQ